MNGANDKVVLALIGAGNRGTQIILGMQKCTSRISLNASVAGKRPMATLSRATKAPSWSIWPIFPTGPGKNSSTLMETKN